MHFYGSLAADDPIVQKRDSLALVLGLSKARVIDVHRGAASRLYLEFLQGKLQQNWTLDAVDMASLKVSVSEHRATHWTTDRVFFPSVFGVVHERLRVRSNASSVFMPNAKCNQCVRCCPERTGRGLVSPCRILPSFFVWLRGTLAQSPLLV